MAAKLLVGPSKSTLGGLVGPANFEATIVLLLSPISEERKSGSLKDCEGPQKHDIKGLNDHWQFLLTSTSGQGETQIRECWRNQYAIMKWLLS